MRFFISFFLFVFAASILKAQTTIEPARISSTNQNNSDTSVNDDPFEKSGINLSAVNVTARKSNLLNSLSALDVKLRPINSSQDILRVVSGLFIAQHAGGGKAEQIFLRGYDIDHGTDINITVDGLPVNMVSHAHGQGYADLHFLIPETVDKASFDKGPYFANQGNLATAGYVALETRDFLESNLVKIQVGQFNTQRALGLFKLLNKDTERSRQQFYLAGEYLRSDGYFESPQDFYRLNLLGKYTANINNKTTLSILGSTLDSKWDASGQIPDRAVRSGMITRFGPIDDSEGGDTRRTNFSVKLNRQHKNNWQSSNQVYYTNYQFNLYSNFTFFLSDPVNGDAINQKESRDLFGYTTSLSRKHSNQLKKAETELGWGFRSDHVSNIELNNVVKRNFLAHVQKGKVSEQNYFGYIDHQVDLGTRFNLSAGLRFDHFVFGYRNILAGETSFRKQNRSTFSPKLNFSVTASPHVKIYLNSGIGFHSNDTRVILDQGADKILPKVYGLDLGMVIKAGRSLVLKSALWHLYSEQEFVYVGDAGIVEPSGKTRRIGLDISGRYQVNRWLFADLDLNFARPRALGEPKGNDYVPLAPGFTSIGGLTVKTRKSFNGSLRYRLIGDRPANEDYSVTADGYFLLDAVASYTWKKFELSLSAENIFNREWKEAQFDTESRLLNEPSPVSEIHFTPGTPRFLKLGLSFIF